MKLERSAQATRRPSLGPWAMAIVLAAMWAILALLPATGDRFLTQGNFASLMSQTAVLLVASVGMTLAILIRGIDLSVGAGVALTGVVAALAHAKLGLPVPLAIVTAIGAGALIGAWHGLWVAWLGVPAFIATLAGFKAYRGGALLLSHATTVQMDDFDVFNHPLPVGVTWALVLGLLAVGVAITLREATRRKQLGLPPLTSLAVGGRLAGQALLAALVLAIYGGRGMPVLVVVAGAVALAGVFVTRRTRFGRHLFAIGGNPEAARLSGIDVKRATLYVYIILGVLVAIAGVLAGARTVSVTPGTQGNLLELDAVTAVVIGGTSLSGGRGSVAGTVLGTLVFGTLSNGMNLLHIDSDWQWVFTGMILLVAALIDVLSKGKRS
ncbi:MAG: sugar ABC transporter permease [Acidobacteriota bacterium]